ncbi:ABC transporter permease [Halobaculum sp. P14]|uniref:ABC transporter permease n=1 Tax=Halobaculum sp. P14 TaxID=3421638 RepID=UPI003EB800E8
MATDTESGGEHTGLSTGRVSPGRAARALAALRGVFVPVTERDRARRRLVLLCLPFASLAAVAGFYPLWEMLKISLSTQQFTTTVNVVDVAATSVRRLQPSFPGVSVEAYRTLFTDGYYRAVAVNTVWFAVATTLGALAVAVPVAHALEKYDLPAKGAVLTVLSFPNSLPGIVAAFMIIVLAGNAGLVTNLLAFLSGRPPTSLAVATSVVGLFFGYLYTMVPRALLLLRGTYAEVNTDAEEAARALGASPWRTFRYVTFPQIRSGVVGAGILSLRTAFAIFGTVLILTAIQPPVWTLQINRELANGFNIRVASAMATVWFAFVLGFTVLGLRYTDAEVGM